MTQHPYARWLGRIFDAASDPVGASDVDWIAAHRLEPLAGYLYDQHPHPLEPVSENQQTNWRAAYARTLMRGLRHLQEATRIGSVFDAANLPCVWTRGPFYGATLYRDVACRPFTDLDLTVSPSASRHAYQVLVNAGYRLRSPGVPAWYFRRYHLHWPLQHNPSGILLDAHWAVDHPLSPLRLDVERMISCAVRQTVDGMAWDEPSPRDHVILAALHAAKESPGTEDPILGGDAPGRLLTWLDLGLLLQRHGETLDWDDLRITAERSGCQLALLTTLRRLRTLVTGSDVERTLGLPKDIEPLPFRVNLARGAGVLESSSPAAIQGWAGRIGFRPRRIKEALAWSSLNVDSQHPLFAWWIGSVRWIRRCLFLAEGAVSAAMCLGWHRLGRGVRTGDASP